MSYKANIQAHIESTQNVIEKCQQELSLKSHEKHIRDSWETVLAEAQENLRRLNHTLSMRCFC